MLIPGYTITEKVHEGDNSLVFRALRDGDGTPVVLKLPPRDYPTLRELIRFRHEYRILQYLHSPRVIRTLGLEQQGHRPVLVLEDPGATPLHDLIQGEAALRRSVAERLQWCLLLALALGDIHDAHVVHKDLIPDNILLGPGHQELRLIDFGIATLDLPDSGGTELGEQADMIEGHLSHISPEQAGMTAHGGGDWRSDLYALGITCFQIVTGELPFTAEDPLALLHCHLAASPPHAHQRRPELPRVVSHILRRLMAKAPEERYQSARGVVGDLERVLAGLRHGEGLDEFPLGTLDSPQHFSVPQTLYGRDEELAHLVRTFERCARGGGELLLVTGVPGIGKTALIRQLHPQVAARNGLFIEGKFDLLQRGTPFLGLAQAFQDLVRQLAGRSPAELEHWKARILEAVGPNGRILLELAPDMELIIGPQPELPRLGQTEALNRFNRVLGSFLQALCSDEHPLLLFLDDLQWADTPSLELLRELLQGRNQGHVLFLGAYRDNEVGPSHPLRRVLDTLREQGAGVGEVVLGPLDLDSVTRLVAETLGGPGARAAERGGQSLVGRLAKELLEKTGGNPFFLRQYLVHLHAQGVIHRPQGAKTWTCDPSRVAALDVADNVASLLAERIGLLPEGTRSLLQAAACLGNAFDLEILALVSGTDESEIQATLIPAIRAGLLLPQAGALQVRDRSLTLHQAFRRFKFLHDREQQAAYALTPEEERPALHLRMGRILRERLEALPGQRRGKLLFDVADHLNLGLPLISDREERLALVRLNREAGLQARASAAYEPSLAYFRQAWAALPEDSPQRERALVFELHTELARALSWAGQHEQAEEWVRRGLGQARNALEQVTLLRILISQHTLLGQLPQALALGMDALRLLGMDLPASPEDMDRCSAELFPVLQARMRETHPDVFYELPELQDPEARACIEVVAELAGSASVGHHSLWRLVVLRVLDIATVQGHTPESLGAYICFSNLLVVQERDYVAARPLRDLCWRLMRKFPDGYCDAIYEAMISFHIAPWSMSMVEALASARAAEQKALENGAFVYVGFARLMYCSRLFLNSSNLNQLLGALAQESEQYQRDKQRLALDSIRGLQLVTASLAGLIAVQSDSACGELGEAAYLEELEQNNNLISLAVYQTFKSLALTIHGQWEQAVTLLLLPVMDSTIFVGSCFSTVRIFLLALILGARAPHELGPEEQALRGEFLEHMDILARTHPGNFLGNRCLARAEAARSEGRDLEAADLFDQAIAANQGNSNFFRALACERAGLFWLGRGNQIVARAYLREARYLYELWGAKPKLRLMAAAHGPLLATSHGEEGGTGRRRETPLAVDSDHTSFLSRSTADLAAIMKSARSISEEIELESLLPRLLAVMCEHAGAERGIYLEARGDTLLPRALFSGRPQMETGQPGFTARLLEPGETHQEAGYVRSVVSLALRKGEPVLLEEPAGDPERRQPGSVLCLPVIRQGRVQGALYFENDLTPGVFSRNIVPALETLAAQAAISLENATLYSSLREAEQRYRSIFENSPAGIFQTTPEGDILVVNPAAARIMGFEDPADFVRFVRSLEQDFYVNPGDRELFVHRLGAGAVTGFETQARTKDGGRVWVSISAQGQQDAAGRLTRIDGFFEDVTRRREDEERIRRLSHELLRIQEAERGRLSRELHDQLAQSLVAMKLNLYVLAQRLGPNPSLGRLEEQLEQAIQSVRQLSYMLRPPDLENFGLMRALEILCSMMTKGTGVDAVCTLSEDAVPDLSADAQTNLYRLVQETLQNTLKHARARRFSLSLARSGSCLRLCMEDDGQGFDPATRMRQAAEDKRLGLLGMRERAWLLGGELEIRSAPGQGTRVTLDIPV